LDQIDELALTDDALRAYYLNERGRAAFISGTPDGLARALDYFARSITAQSNSRTWLNLAQARDRAGDRQSAITALFTALDSSDSLAYSDNW
jgi:hypothetical protein